MLEGMVVSDVADQAIDCIAFSDADIDAETGIIDSVIDREVTGKIVEYINSQCSREQLFLLADCTAIRQQHLR